MAVRTGLEPATPGVTGRYSNQLNYRTTRFISPMALAISIKLKSGSSLLSHGETPHYHRRYGISLLSSAWGQVGPPRYCRQTNSFLPIPFQYAVISAHSPTSVGARHPQPQVTPLRVISRQDRLLNKLKFFSLLKTPSVLSG